MHILLSPQFLAEDYSLVDVLYYVTRDDLKCLRLRYRFCFCSVVTKAGALGGDPAVWAPWLVWLSGLSAGLCPDRAHAWVTGQVPSWGRVRGNRLMFFLHIGVSLLLSFPSPLSENK